MICKSNSNMGHVGSKVGCKVKLKENLVNTLEAAISASAVRNFVRMFVLLISRSSLNMYHFGSETKSLGQIEGKSC